MSNSEVFDFYQLVRELEISEKINNKNDSWVGYDVSPDKEKIKFSTDLSLGFPSKAVKYFKENDDKYKIDVSFLGLTNDLPEHYLEHILIRGREKDHAMRKFFDLFNHRLISFYYRAWKKYRPDSNWEESTLKDYSVDHYSKILSALACTPEDDNLFLYHTGHMARKTRPPSGLSNMLIDYLTVPVKIKEFQGTWLKINKNERSMLQLGKFNELNRDVILGRYIWDIQSKFLVEIGEIDLHLFHELMPGKPKNNRIREIIKRYAGDDMSFDINVLIRRGSCPKLTLNNKKINTKLGISSWLGQSKNIDELVSVRF